MFKGIFTALLTPFKDGEIDLYSFHSMIEWQIDSGVHGLVVGGSTGEGQSLNKKELAKLVETAVKIAKGKLTIIANTGLSSTENTLELTKTMQDLGVDGVLLVSPYYVRPTQEGLYQHFKHIHDKTNMPIILYNHPMRSGVSMDDTTILRLAELPRIKALKDCSGNPLKCTKLKQSLRDDDLSIFSGDDILAMQYYSQGAVGVISSVANIVPSLIVKLYNLWCDNKIKEAIDLQSILFPLNEGLFCESNPIAVKYAASQFGLCRDELRMPLIGPSEENKKLVLKILEDLRSKLT